VSTSGAVTLAEIADRGRTLEIECADCTRFGRYQIHRLIERYGPNMGLPRHAGNAGGRLPSPALGLDL
jgi:hypothetical protein